MKFLGSVINFVGSICESLNPYLYLKGVKLK